MIARPRHRLMLYVGPDRRSASAARVVRSVLPHLPRDVGYARDAATLSRTLLTPVLLVVSPDRRLIPLRAELRSKPELLAALERAGVPLLRPSGRRR